MQEALTAKIAETVRSSVEDQIKKSLQDCDQPLPIAESPILTNINSELARLSTELKAFASSKAHQEPVLLPKPAEAIESIRDPPSPTKLHPYDNHYVDYITEDCAKELMEFLEQENFAKEGTREVGFYGEKYQYMGSRKEPKPIPPIIQTLLDDLNSNLNSNHKLNQVLVNKYTGANASLPRHSDNEWDIHPQSSIHTISIGAPAKIMFTKSGNDDHPTELVVNHRSLYVMSRASQDAYKHQILPDPENTVRYSLTFRTVHWTNLNSTYAVGDSNFGKIKFGTGKGTIGAATPGVRDFSCHVKDIAPSKYTSYKNVVVMFGTNDLKVPGVDVLETYKVYKGKIEEIRDLNPRGNIIICPVLPSRDISINKRIVQFNNYLFSDLAQGNIRVNIVHGFNQFVDREGRLRSVLHDRRTEHDVLHINDDGYRILVRLIKNCIFTVKRSRGRYTTERLYASVVAAQQVGPGSGRQDPGRQAPPWPRPRRSR